ncbi:MAG: DapH/DapD/GlmU-related protein [Candidatus Gracilibacteria bacterium]|nr:DapH/DapD/GlmU-related protein [Candidatus Gracilibacteria bacterium]
MSVQQKQLPKIILGLMAMRWPLAFGIIRQAIKRCLPQLKNSDFTFGFECQFGNIYAENVWLGDTIFIDHVPVHIGSGTQFSRGNMVITGTHDPCDFNKAIFKEVNIGKNCWITSRVTILPGVNIGDNTIIGAGSVVTENIPANCIAVGVPCKVLRYL